MKKHEDDTKNAPEYAPGEHEAVERTARNTSPESVLRWNVRKRYLKWVALFGGAMFILMMAATFGLSYGVDRMVYWATGAKAVHKVPVWGAALGYVIGVVLSLVSQLHVCQEMGRHIQIGKYLRVPYKMLSAVAVVIMTCLMTLLVVRGQTAVAGVTQFDVDLVANIVGFLLTFASGILVIFSVIAELPDEKLLQEEKRKLGISD